MTPGTALALLNRLLAFDLSPLVLAALWFVVPSAGLWIVTVGVLVLTPLAGYVLVTQRRWGWIAAYGACVVAPVLVGVPAHASPVGQYVWTLLPFGSTLVYGLALKGAVAAWHLERTYALQWQYDDALSERGSPRTER